MERTRRRERLLSETDDRKEAASAATAGVGEAVDPGEDEYWRDVYEEWPYYRDDFTYEDYEPAFRLGYNAGSAHRRPYDDNIAAELQARYEQCCSGSPLRWEDARHAVRDAYRRRVEQAMVADAG